MAKTFTIINCGEFTKIASGFVEENELIEDKEILEGISEALETRSSDKLEVYYMLYLDGEEGIEEIDIDIIEEIDIDTEVDIVDYLSIDIREEVILDTVDI